MVMDNNNVSASVEPMHTLETLTLECFLTIVDYLDANTVMQLCKTNATFRANILLYKHVLSNKTFDIEEFIDFRPIFAEYGHFIRKLDVNQYNMMHDRFSLKFNIFLHNVVIYLMPGNLTELTLRFGVISIDKHLLERALPFFCNLSKFAFTSCGSNDFSHAQEYVLSKIIGNAQQLKSLDIRYLRTAGEWLTFKHLQNLNDLTILFVEFTAIRYYRQFMESKPKLKSFIISIPSIHHQHTCRFVTKYMPNLEVFEIRNAYMELPHGDDFDFSYEPFESQVEKEETNANQSDQYAEYYDEIEEDTSYLSSDEETDFETEESDSEIDDFRDGVLNFHHFDEIKTWNDIYTNLYNMKYLKRTWLKSHYANCSDLYDVLKMLAKQNTVEYLTLQIHQLDPDFLHINSAIDPFPSTFTALKTLRLISPCSRYRYFLHQFIYPLPNLTKCIVDMDKICDNARQIIAQLVQYAQKLNTLVLKMPSMNFDSALYMQLKGIRYCQSQSKPLNIYINSIPHQHKCLFDLNENYDENIIALKVKSFMSWETDPV